MTSIGQATLARIARNAISDEVIKAMGLCPVSWPGKLLVPIVRLATTRFARLMAIFDRHVGDLGAQKAARRLLLNMAQSCRQSGAAAIPDRGDTTKVVSFLKEIGYTVAKAQPSISRLDAHAPTGRHRSPREQ